MGWGEVQSVMTAAPDANGYVSVTIFQFLNKEKT